jgi:prevent-host-death family protein
MHTVTITELKAHFREFIDRTASGEAIEITRRGKIVAQLIAVPTPRKKIDVAALKALTDKMPFDPESAGDFVRRMRDTDRY